MSEDGTTPDAPAPVETPDPATAVAATPGLAAPTPAPAPAPVPAAPTAEEIKAQEDAATKAKADAETALRADERTKYEKEIQVKALALVTDWKALTEADKELGGEALNANLAIAKAALNATASPELMKMMAEPPDGLGWGNHPEVIRHFYRIGKMLGPDGMVRGGINPKPERTAKDFYPNSDHT